jgi:uncharacterized membrane protein
MLITVAAKALTALIVTGITAALFKFGIDDIEGEVEVIVTAIVSALAVYLVPNQPAP